MIRVDLRYLALSIGERTEIDRKSTQRDVLTIAEVDRQIAHAGRKMKYTFCELIVKSFTPFSLNCNVLPVKSYVPAGIVNEDSPGRDRFRQIRQHGIGAQHSTGNLRRRTNLRRITCGRLGRFVIKWPPIGLGRRIVLRHIGDQDRVFHHLEAVVGCASGIASAAMSRRPSSSSAFLNRDRKRSRLRRPDEAFRRLHNPHKRWAIPPGSRSNIRRIPSFEHPVGAGLWRGA